MTFLNLVFPHFGQESNRVNAKNTHVVIFKNKIVSFHVVARSLRNTIFLLFGKVEGIFSNIMNHNHRC